MLEILGHVISNRHVASCGDPPEWIREAPPDKGRFRRFYFENNYGEQWFARIDGQTLRVTGGDLSWRTFVLSLEAGWRKDPAERRLEALLDGDIILNSAERAWLGAVMLVFRDGSGSNREPPPSAASAPDVG